MGEGPWELLFPTDLPVEIFLFFFFFNFIIFCATGAKLTPFLALRSSPKPDLLT